MNKKVSTPSLRFRALLIGAVSFFPAYANADFDSLACYGVADRWTSEANRILGLVENTTNAAVNEYVSLANFDIGSSQFGVQGNASLGSLTTPPFTCSDPKLTLKSGMSDFGLAPQYLINAYIFGMRVNIVDARMEGAQGQRTAKNPPATRKKKVLFTLKVLGVDVLHKIRKGPEIEARTADELKAMVGAPSPGDLPSKEKTGTGGTLVDFSRSISQFFKGVAPRIDIVPGALYVEIDAGFYLQSSLIFSYGIDSSIYSFHGGAGIGPNATALERNPANAMDNICEAPDTSDANAPACQYSPAQLPSKGKEFYSKLASGVTTNRDRALKMREQLRSIKMKEVLADAKILRKSFGEDWDAVTASGLSINERKDIIQQIDMGSRMRPLQGQADKLKAATDTAKSIQSDLAYAYSTIQNAIAVTKNGIPEVRADAGLALTGRVGVWASAVLALDAGIARGWAGIVGYLTLIDIRAGVGASLSTKSQFVDLTASLQTIRMAGGLDLIYGVSVGVNPFLVKFEGSRNLYSFPGTMTSQEWLVGRLDFRAAQSGKSFLFWCQDIFGSTTIDPERCSDVDVSRAQLAPTFAAYDAMKKDVLGEFVLEDPASCILSDGGKPIYATASTGTCSSLLPANSSTALTPLSPGVEHPLTRYFNLRPEEFMSDLRNSSNEPVKVFSSNTIANSVMGTPTSNVYVGDAGVAPPTLGGASGNVLTFTERLPYDFSSEASLGSRIFTVASRSQQVRAGLTDPVEVADSSYPGLLIDMDWVSRSNLWPSSWQASVSGVTNPRIFVGDVGALPNGLLLEMAKTYRLGRCGARVDGNEIYLNLSGRPYPLDGEVEGKVSENLQNPDDSCFSGTANLGEDSKVVFSACSLRRAIRQNECFPADRVLSLVRLANLSNTDTLRYFTATVGTSDHRITGQVIPYNRYGSRSNVQIARLDTNDGNNAVNYFWYNTFYNAQNCPTLPRHDSTDDRWASPVYEESAWLQLRAWDVNHPLAANEHFKAFYLHYRPTTSFYSVGTDPSDFQNRRNIGQESSTYFKAIYNSNRAPSDGVNANWDGGILCNTGNPEHVLNFAMTRYNGSLLQNARSSPDAGIGLEFASAIKECIKMDSKPCVYTPDGEDADAAAILASTCTMKVQDVPVSGTGQAFLQVGPVGTSSIDGCIQQSTTPRFADAQSFCNDASVAPRIKTLLNISDGATTAVNRVVNLTAIWDVSRTNNNVGGATNHEDRAIGKCFVNRIANSSIITITGQTSDLRGLASTSARSCELYVDKPGGGSSLITQFARDPNPNFDPTATDAKCTETLGFSGTSTEIEAKANAYCSNLSNSDRLAIFAPQVPATGTGSFRATANLKYFISNGPSGTGSIYNVPCSVTRTFAEWATELSQGACNVQLSPISSGNAISQTVALAIGSGGRSACETSVNSYLNCSTIRSNPIYIPYASTGITLTASYAGSAIGSPSTLSCAAAPYAPNADLTTSTSCKLSGWFDIPVQSYSSSAAEFDKALLTTSVNASNLLSAASGGAGAVTSACASQWTSQITSVNAGATAFPNLLFCTSALSAVDDALYSKRASVFGCSTSINSTNPCPLRSGGIWTTDTGSAPIDGTLPLTVNFRSHYAAAPVSPTTARSTDTLAVSCRYEYRSVNGSTEFYKLVAEGAPVDGDIIPGYGDTPVEAQCIRPSVGVPGDTANASCVTLAPGQTLLFGGAGPGLLAKTSGTAPAYAANATSTCSTFTPQMTPISDLKEADPAKRLPMWVATVGADGKVTLPKETETPAFYCQVPSCSLSAEYSGESHEVDLGFFANWGIKPTSVSACENMHLSSADTVCSDLRADDTIPDNFPIDLVSHFGSQTRVIKTCDDVTPKACIIGANRNSGEELFPLAEKPVGNGLIQSLSGHSAVFGTPNTKEECAKFFDLTTDHSPYCEMANGFAHDSSHPGEIFSIYRKFGNDTDFRSYCHTALNINASPSEADLRVQWTSVSNYGGNYELQYCKGSGCTPSAVTDETHFSMLIPVGDGASKVVSTEPGELYSFRVRLISASTNTVPSVEWPWSWVVTTTSPGDPLPPLPLPVMTVDVYEYPRDRLVMNWVPINGNISGFYEIAICHGVGCDPRTATWITGSQAPPLEIQPNHPDVIGLRIRFKMHRTNLPAVAYPWSATTVYVRTSCILFTAQGWEFCPGSGPGTSTHPSVGVGTPVGIVAETLEGKTTDRLLLDACLGLNWRACGEYIGVVRKDDQMVAAAEIDQKLGSTNTESLVCRYLGLFCAAPPVDNTGSGGSTGGGGSTDTPPAENTGNQLDSLAFAEKLPDTVGWISADGSSPTAKFVPLAIPGVTYQCRAGYRHNIDKQEWTDCERQGGKEPLFSMQNIKTIEGRYVFEARAKLGEKVGKSISQEFYAHPSLDSVPLCAPLALRNDIYFDTARKYLDGGSKFGKETQLGNLPEVAIQFDSNEVASFKTLRLRFEMSNEGDLILFRRAYLSTETSTCESVDSTSVPNEPIPSMQPSYACHVIVFTSKGQAACFDEKDNLRAFRRGFSNTLLKPRMVDGDPNGFYDGVQELQMIQVGGDGGPDIVMYPHDPIIRTERQKLLDGCVNGDIGLCSKYIESFPKEEREKAAETIKNLTQGEISLPTKLPPIRVEYESSDPLPVKTFIPLPEATAVQEQVEILVPNPVQTLVPQPIETRIPKRTQVEEFNFTAE